MDELQKARESINQVDSAMAELFSRRMEAVRAVAEYKQARGIPIFDGNRERAVLERNSALIQSEEIRGYYVSFLQHLMDLSKQYQHRLMEGMRVAYSGGEGAFAELAARRIFPEGKHVGYPDFKAAYRAVAAGDCDCAVLPIENSYAGIVDQVMDLMFGGELQINGVYTLPVVQNLLGVPGATVEGIRQVISHPQALSQCEGYTAAHGFRTMTAANTALAAKTVAEQRDPSLGAIASAETAALYGLEILAESINESAANTTKFAVFSRTENLSGDRRGKFILMFTVGDVPGALAGAINVISDYGFNMKVLRSRPVRDRAWQYYFYVEIEGDETTENGRRMLEELAGRCETLKIVGHYAREVAL